MGTFTKGGAFLGWRDTGKGPCSQKEELVGKASLEEALEHWALTMKRSLWRHIQRIVV